MSPMDRLLAEALPTGTFGDAQPTRRAGREIRRWTQEEQARHLAELAEAVGEPRLRVIRGEAA